MLITTNKWLIHRVFLNDVYSMYSMLSMLITSNKWLIHRVFFE